MLEIVTSTAFTFEDDLTLKGLVAHFRVRGFEVRTEMVDDEAATHCEFTVEGILWPVLVVTRGLDEGHPMYWVSLGDLDFPPERTLSEALVGVRQTTPCLIQRTLKAALTM